MAGRPRATAPRMLRVASVGEVLIGVAGERVRVERYTDLSLGGLFVESMFPEERGTRLKVDLEVGPQRLRLPAEVIWTRPVTISARERSGMGVAFEQLTTPQKKLLYVELSRAVREGAERKSGTPPSERARGGGGLRALFDRLRGK